MTVVLGIDPGTTRVGFGVVEDNGGDRLTLRDCGLIPITQKERFARLAELQKGLKKIIRVHSPHVVGMEKLHFSQNRTTGLQVAEAIGVIGLTITAAHLPLYEYGPREVKKSITGYGGADKRAVAKTIQKLMRHRMGNLIDDATDAVAVAVTTALLCEKKADAWKIKFLGKRLAP